MAECGKPILKSLWGAAAAEEMGLELGDEFQSSHGLIIDDNLVHEDAHALKVVGIMKGSGSVIDQLILCNPETVWGVHDDHAEEAPSDAAEEAGPAEEGHQHTNGVAKALTDYPDKEITSLLLQFKARNIQSLNFLRGINENTDMQAAAPAIELNRLYDMMDVGEQTLRIIAMVIIFVSALSIFISLFSSLKDRKYELALMRVMGASRFKVFLLIIFEGFILAVLGYIIGIALSHLGMEIVAGAMKDAYRYSFTGKVFLKEEVLLFAAALFIGFVAAILPAIQASRTDISRTLAKT